MDYRTGVCSEGLGDYGTFVLHKEQAKQRALKSNIKRDCHHDVYLGSLQ